MGAPIIARCPYLRIVSQSHAARAWSWATLRSRVQLPRRPSQPSFKIDDLRHRFTAKHRCNSAVSDRPNVGSSSVHCVLLVVFIFQTLLAAGTGMAGTPKLAEAELIVPAQELPSVLTEEYRINVGDVLGIDFYKTTEFSQDVTVGPDGAIHLPLVGRVSVVGRTVDDVRAELMEGFGREMVNPQITLSVREFSGLSVYVMGEVFNPGELEYRGGLTLLQAISEAGGFNIKARRKQVLLIRPGPDFEPVGTLVNVREILRRGELANDVVLAPLDIIYVHHKEIVNVNNFVELYISRNLPRFGAWMWYLPGYRGE